MTHRLQTAPCRPCTPAVHMQQMEGHTAQLKGHDTDVHKLHAECVSYVVCMYVCVEILYMRIRIHTVHTDAHMLHTCCTHVCAYNTTLSQVKQNTILSGIHGIAYARINAHVRVRTHTHTHTMDAHTHTQHSLESNG